MAIDATLRWINLREHAAYVTDGANQTVFPLDSSQSSSELYGQGNNSGVSLGGQTYTCGWEKTGTVSVNIRDRTTSGDVRLAGGHFIAQDGSGYGDFRLDLDAAGTYEIHLACAGDTGANANQYVAIYDSTTLKATVIDSAGGLAADHFADATGVDRTRAAWPGAEVGVSVTMASTILRIRTGKTANGSGAAFLNAIGIKLLSGDVSTSPSGVSSSVSAGTIAPLTQPAPPYTITTVRG